MKFKFILLIVLYISSFSFSQTSLFIKYKSNISIEEVNQKVETKTISKNNQVNRQANSVVKVNHLAKGIIKNDDVLSRIIKVDFESQSALREFQALLSTDPDIEYTQPANYYKIDSTPNDSLASAQWALEKINAYNAWNITQGSDTVLLAVIDTGIDYLHPDLKNKIYINTGETGLDNQGNDKRSNSIDDDNIGFVDDWHGWDFTDRVGFPFDSTGGDYLNWDNDPMDENNHGTYIAGIAGAETNNLTGIAGTAPKIKMLNLRAFDPGGYGEEDDVAAAILYAVQSGAKVINMSFGDYSFSFVLRDVVRYAYLHDVVLIASAGNIGSNEPHYPSGYSEVISIGNSTEQDYVAGGSNYGSTLDLVAPGSSILTTARNDNYSIISGTSASAPFVSASASLIRSLGNFTNEEIKQMLKSTADDIGEPGWDLKSGAGRLNLFKALSVVAPSVIKFDYPKQDFNTLKDTLNINATILSAYFSKYNLYYGTGLNPTSWNSLLSGIKNQTASENIFTMPLQTLPDTVYTLRLLVYLSNGRTMEERVNFFINRTPPVAQLISVGPALYGERATIMAALHTDEPSIARMYYRKQGITTFQFVTLDGFATNNQFVKNYHYGFIPKQLVEQGSSYEVYFEAENLVGLKTVIKDNNQNFIFVPDFDAAISAETELPYNLPVGNIFAQPLNLTTPDYNEVALRELLNPRWTSIFQFQNDTLVKIDSVKEQIFRDFGDFNFNGKKDFLSSFVRDGFILEQASTGSSKLDVKFADSSGGFWPVLTADVDNDGIMEVLVVDSDTSFALWEINSSLKVENKISLPNFSPIGLFQNQFDSPGAVVADLNKNGFNEIWMIDRDGDLFSYEFNGTGFVKGQVFSTEFLGSASALTVGDYNGDGNMDLAILLHSIDALDIAPFHRLLILEYSNNTFAPMYDKAFIDPSTEFTAFFADYNNSIKFVDVDSDSKDELVLFIYPYSYIFKYNSGRSTIISYKETINSNAVFAGDLNQNGVTEIGFPSLNGIKFYEFAVSQKASTPRELL
ncbi:MAG: S8 family serine peptidase, partial [Ignavibacteriaceae bacterium]|nr:S8 family serine peptidase [Ignavibacteriaceae bacterium]